jgi:hypothetical protein
MDLIDEYKAAERADYVTWGGNHPSGASFPAPSPTSAAAGHQPPGKGMAGEDAY